MHGNPVQPLGRAWRPVRAARRCGLPRERARAAPAAPAPAAALAVALLLALVFALAAPPAHAEGRLQKVRGSLGIGYAKLLTDPAPGGSFSMGAGVDYPVASSWRAGLAIGYALLGGRIVEEGSFAASVDYSMFEILALAHWQPSFGGPLGRISLGPGLFSPLADLSTSSGGASFGKYAVDEIALGVAIDGTLMQRRDAPVRIGLEVGLRFVFLEQDTWDMAQVRLAFHY